MKKLISIVSKAALGVLALSAQAHAGLSEYKVYCNTLVQAKAVTPSWVTNTAVDEALKQLGYSMIRDADFRGSDFKQVSPNVALLPSTQEALIFAVKVCGIEKKYLVEGLIERFNRGRVPLDAAIYQCAYVYDGAGNYITQACPSIPALQIR